jgi:S1-C subfamily serine protease
MNRSIAVRFTAAACIACAGTAAANLLTDMEREMADLVGTVSPGVVQVVAERDEARPGPWRTPLGPFWAPAPRRGTGRSSGSGFVIDREGHVLTTLNVIEGTVRVRVVLKDGSEHPADVRGVDRSLNIALLKVGGPKLTALTLGDSDGVRAGSPFIALGNPYGLPTSVTGGIVGGRGRSGLGVAEVEDLIQINADINPGDSGGPLLNMRGEVVGILAASMSRRGPADERSDAQGIAFAIPINAVKEILPGLKGGGEVEHGWLGVAIQELTPPLQAEFGIRDGRGVVIAGVVESSPADRAGVKEGDVVRSFDNTPVRSPQELISLVSKKKIGEKASLSIMRDGREIAVEVAVEKKGEGAGRGVRSAAAEGLGLILEEVTPQIAARFDLSEGCGILVADVVPGSPAARAGLRRGDIIVEVNRKSVSHPGDWEAIPSGTKVLVRTQRGFFVIRSE